jgi:hypothetical protein
LPPISGGGFVSSSRSTTSSREGKWIFVWRQLLFPVNDNHNSR